MKPIYWAALLYPLVLLTLSLFVLNPVKRWITNKMKDGKLKRLLLRRVN